MPKGAQEVRSRGADCLFWGERYCVCQENPGHARDPTLIEQLVSAGTSVGANYCEADDAESKKDFRHKICLCRKEARETKYWLRMNASAVTAEELKAEARVLWQEAKELHL